MIFDINYDVFYGTFSLISMRLLKEYARSATADTENAPTIHEQAP